MPTKMGLPMFVSPVSGAISTSSYSYLEISLCVILLSKTFEPQLHFKAGGRLIPNKKHHKNVASMRNMLLSGVCISVRI